MENKFYVPAVLLTTNNTKTIKGEKLGYITYILYMSPFRANSTGKSVCSHASKGCIDSCLVGSGFGGMYTGVQAGRRNKTEYFLADRKSFLEQLDREISKAVEKHKGKAIVTIRLNGTSDIPYENLKVRDNKTLFDLHPKIQFYDYTKNYLRFDKSLPKNYHLTFSRSETNHDKAMGLLSRGFNVAMVFEKVPKKFEGFKVVDGDESDLRFLDKKNVIVGLKYKKMTGKGANNSQAFTSGFAIRTNIISLVQKVLKKAA
jgi:hypothetical protein